MHVCAWKMFYLGAVHWWWKRVRRMLLAAPRGVPARRCCATAGRWVELSAGVWMHLLFSKTTAYKKDKRNDRLFNLIIKLTPSYIPFARFINGNCADLWRGPAFYSELEFYEWNLCGETEPSDRGRGERGGGGVNEQMFFNLTIRCAKMSARFHQIFFYLDTFYSCKCQKITSICPATPPPTCGAHRHEWTTSFHVCSICIVYIMFPLCPRI